MDTRKRSALAILCVVIAVSAGAVAAVGVFMRGGESERVTSVRGESYEMRTDGVYRYNAERLVAEGIGWDAFTLFVAAPALLIATYFVAKGTLAGKLFTVGLLAYFFYQYLMYAVTWAFGPLFPTFVVIYAASLVALAWLAWDIGVEGLASRFTERFPRRGMAGLSLFFAVLLIGMWSVRIDAGLRGDLADAMLIGQTTLVVQALDLGLIVPLAALTGVALLRRWPVGFLLAPVLAVKAVAMGGAIIAMVISAWSVEGTLDVAPLVIFAAATAAAVWLAVRILRSLTPERPEWSP